MESEGFIKRTEASEVKEWKFLNLEVTCIFFSIRNLLPFFYRVICGSRVRVELSTGMPRRSRFDRPPARRPFDPNDRCYECGEKGHYAYDCHRYSRRRRSRYLF